MDIMTSRRAEIPPYQPTRNPALAGTLRDWSLVDVIQLLDLGKKTGAVVVHGRRDTDAIDGQITFLEGTIHHARHGERQGIEAVFDLFGATDGTFRFTNLDEVPPRNIYLSNEHVIIEGIARQDPPRPALVESPATITYRLVPVPRHKHERIILTGEQWRLIARMEGETTLTALAEHLHYSPTRIREILYDLVALGLVEEREK